ncbi:hypothetical protein QAD02_001479 [Eretmocerus hayati]|uniref:Uncharacterized protein n=1 Tax=Eretmocerus hayati TaxID=131215 RepID=A0ACC2NGC5_9HYME|nr:hypothetical protein QAD02_001479 [Eretmocerus hayati]
MNKVPKKSSSGVGYNVRTERSLVVSPRDEVEVDTGLRIDLPEGVHANVRERLTFFLQTKLRIFPGVVDDPNVSVKIFLINPTNETVRVKAGTKIAQIIPYSTYSGDLKFVPIKRKQQDEVSSEEVRSTNKIIKNLDV